MEKRPTYHVGSWALHQLLLQAFCVGPDTPTATSRLSGKPALSLQGKVRQPDLFSHLPCLPASPHPPPSLAQHSSQSAQQAHQATPCWELSDGSCPPLNKSPTLSGLSTPHPQPPTSSTPLSPLQQQWALHYLEPLGTRWPQCLCTCSGRCLEAILQVSTEFTPCFLQS